MLVPACPVLSSPPRHAPFNRVTCWKPALYCEARHPGSSFCKRYMMSSARLVLSRSWMLSIACSVWHSANTWHSAEFTVVRVSHSFIRTRWPTWASEASDLLYIFLSSPVPPLPVYSRAPIRYIIGPYSCYGLPRGRSHLTIPSITVFTVNLLCFCRCDRIVSASSSLCNVFLLSAYDSWYIYSA